MHWVKRQTFLQGETWLTNIFRAFVSELVPLASYCNEIIIRVITNKKFTSPKKLKVLRRDISETLLPRIITSIVPIILSRQTIFV